MFEQLFENMLLEAKCKTNEIVFGIHVDVCLKNVVVETNVCLKTKMKLLCFKIVLKTLLESCLMLLV